MKITIYGAKPEPIPFAKLMEAVPETAHTVLIQSNARKPLGIRPCQHPGWLFYEATVDETLFLHLVQEGVDGPITVKQTQ